MKTIAVACNVSCVFILLAAIHLNAQLDVSFKKAQDWKGGYEANVAVTNKSGATIDGWKLSFTLEPGQAIGNYWPKVAEAQFSPEIIHKNISDKPQEVTLVFNKDWAKTINPGGTIADIGFVVSGSSQDPKFKAEALHHEKSGQSATASTIKHIVPFKYPVVAYYPNWHLYPKAKITQFKVSDINPENITHINYAFAKPYTTDRTTKELLSYHVDFTDPWADIGQGPEVHADSLRNPNAHVPTGGLAELIKLKKQYPHLKTLISIGGWEMWQDKKLPSGEIVGRKPAEVFSIIAADPRLRKEFIDSVIDFCALFDFDGIDIDWEYPGFKDNGGREIDKHNFTLLLKEFHDIIKNKEKLRPYYEKLGKIPKESLLLTIAAPAFQSYINNIEVEQIAPYLDKLNIMAYDMHGPWGASQSPTVSPDAATNHHSALYASEYDTRQGYKGFDVKDVVDTYVSRGFPLAKIILGLALYGKSYAGVKTNNNGLYQPYTQAGPGTNPEEPGMIFYDDIVKNYLPSYKRFWDDTTKTPYLFNSDATVFVTYDDKQSLCNKINYLKEKGLAGAMLWPLTNNAQAWDLVKYIRNQLENSNNNCHITNKEDL